MGDNQHYLSQAYQDKFIHPSSTQRVLYPYSRAYGGQKPKGTKKLGCADSFYLQTDGETQNNRLDESRKADEAVLFGSGKNSSGPLAKCIYDDTFIPAAEERVLLAKAAALLRWGSPVQIHNTAMMRLFFEQANLLNLLNGDEAKRLYRQRYGDDAERRLEDDRQLVVDGKLRMDVGEDNWKQVGFDACHTEELWINGLTRMGLAICHCHYKSVFVTSDNPVVLTCVSQPDSPGLGLPDAEAWFPISHNRGLLWSWRHRGVTRAGFGHSETRVMNRRVVKWCFRDVYSPLPQPWIEEALKASTFDPCYGHYGSLQRMLDRHTAPAVVESARGLERSGEIVDVLATLRSGDPCDVVRLGGPPRRRTK